MTANMRTMHHTSIAVVSSPDHPRAGPETKTIPGGRDRNTHPKPSAMATASTSTPGGNNSPQIRSETQQAVGADAVGAVPLITLVRLHAALLDDCEDVRIRHANRLRQIEAIGNTELTTVIADTNTLELLEATESAAVLNLKRYFKGLPIAEFVKATPGLGEKTVARWLGEVGDPAWHTAEDRPRRLSELYAYCGLHVVDGAAPKRCKGQKANWSNKARTRAHNMATGCIKLVGGADKAGRIRQRSPYRDVYDEARVKYADATYADGSPLTDLHKHNRAVRAVMKAIIKDLWHHSKIASTPKS